MRKIQGYGILLLAGTFLLTGCSLQEIEEWSPLTGAALDLSAEGVVTEYLTDTLDQSYYSFSELQAMLEEEVSTYNKEAGEDRIVIEQAEQEEKKVHLVLTYASAEDYASFNHTDFFFGSMINAQIEGYLFDEDFQSVIKGSVQKDGLTSANVTKNMADMVVISGEPVEVHVYGSIDYTTENVHVDSAQTVTPKDTQYEETEIDEEGQNTADGREYIIFAEP